MFKLQFNFKVDMKVPDERVNKYLESTQNQNKILHEVPRHHVSRKEITKLACMAV